MAYISEFKDRNNNSIKVQIETPTNTSETEDVEVLTLADAMSIEYSGESIFDTLRPSRASVNLLLTDIKPDLFSGTLNNVKVKLFKNNSLYWFGYITPNIYTQSYSHVYDQLSLECVDTVAQLENIDYTYINASDSVGIYSFYDVLKHCINLADPSHTITNLYVDSSISLSGESGGILQKLFIKERNFFDEKGEPEKCSEVVKAIALYLQLTFFQYKNSFYLINLKKQANSHTLHKYTYSGGWSNTAVAVSVNPSVKTTAQLGQYGSDVNVSLQGVFNKVTVIGNNNPLAQILPDFDDEDDLVNQNSDPNHYEVEDYTYNDTAYKLVSAFFKSQSNWIYSRPTTEHSLLPYTFVDEVTTANRDSIVSGVWWTKVDDYKTEDGDPSSLNWKTYITMVGGGLLGVTPYLHLQNAKTMILDGGYLIINVNYKFSTDYRPHTAVKSMYDSAGTFGSCTDLTWTSNSDYIGYDNWPDNTMFMCKLTIGNYYYSGDDWVSYDVFNAKVSRGYYSMGSDNIHGYALHGGPGTTHKVGDWENWYRYKNSYGDWIYCTQSQYNAATTEKEQGKTKRNHHFYYINGNGDHVAMCIDYYHEIILRDMFYLVHINKTTETIYDCEYTLTNTVSYKMNIVDSSDGVAIPCPTDQTLYGTLNFTIYPPSKLGTNPQSRSDIAPTTLRAIHISNLSIKYSKTNSTNNIFKNQVDPDTIYSNVIDSTFCKEMDDVEMRVNTQNSWATSYSYVICQSGGLYKYIDGLTFDSVKRKPEEKLVESLVNYYKLPRYTFQRSVQNKISGNANTYEVSPYMPIRESIGGSQKTLVTTSATYNISQNTVNITANEI